MSCFSCFKISWPSFKNVKPKTTGASSTTMPAPAPPQNGISPLQIKRGLNQRNVIQAATQPSPTRPGRQLVEDFKQYQTKLDQFASQKENYSNAISSAEEERKRAQANVKTGVRRWWAGKEENKKLDDLAKEKSTLVTTLRLEKKAIEAEELAEIMAHQKKYEVLFNHDINELSSFKKILEPFATKAQSFIDATNQLDDLEAMQKMIASHANIQEQSKCKFNSEYTILKNRLRRNLEEFLTLPDSNITITEEMPIRNNQRIFIVDGENKKERYARIISKNSFNDSVDECTCHAQMDPQKNIARVYGKIKLNSRFGTGEAVVMDPHLGLYDYKFEEKIKHNVLRKEDATKIRRLIEADIQSATEHMRKNGWEFTSQVTKPAYIVNCDGVTMLTDLSNIRKIACDRGSEQAKSSSSPTIAKAFSVDGIDKGEEERLREIMGQLVQYDFDSNGNKQY